MATYYLSYSQNIFDGGGSDVKIMSGSTIEASSDTEAIELASKILKIVNTNTNYSTRGGRNWEQLFNLDTNSIVDCKLPKR